MGLRHPAFGAAASALPAILLSGCASFGEGLGRAVIAQVEGDPDVDTRACEIEGATFGGIVAELRTQDGQPPIGAVPASERSIVKIMMVHGIGSHYPGYSGRTVANLTEHLGLDVVSPRIKTVDLVHPNFPGESIGTFTGQRFTDASRQREVIIYELTWSGSVMPPGPGSGSTAARCTRATAHGSTRWARSLPTTSWWIHSCT
jgi:hypothetical protein